MGISNIKRIPKNPFSKKKIKSDEYLKHRKELIIKLSIILNKHIHYWLQKEMPKFSKLQLEKHIYSLLKHLKNNFILLMNYILTLYFSILVSFHSTPVPGISGI